MKESLLWISLLLLLVSATAEAKGFYIGPSIGFGGHSAKKIEDPYGKDIYAVNKIEGYSAPSGILASLRFGYNIIDLICIEYEFIAQGWNLSGSGKKGGAGLTGVVFKYSPLWHFEKLRPYSGYAFLRVPVGYTVLGEDDGYAYRGWYWGIGIEGNYQFTSFLSIGASLDYRKPSISERVTNWNDDIKIPINQLTDGQYSTVPGAKHIAFLLHLDFLFVPAR